MTKYDMTAIRYLEPGFLPLARNRKSYICPNCGSGSGKNGSGMTSRDGEYWKCWSCGLSANKVELFRIQNSLNYEEACAGILKFYGIVPTPIGETSKNRRYGSEPGNGVFLTKKCYPQKIWHLKRCDILYYNEKKSYNPI